MTATPFVLTDAKITINAVNLSTWITSATITVDVDDQETTAFGSTWKTKIGGLKDFKLDLEFNQDFGASAVDVTLWSLVGTSTAITIKSTSGANSATNPEYSGNVLVNSYAPIDGGVGDKASIKVSWPGNGALSRAVA